MLHDLARLRRFLGAGLGLACRWRRTKLVWPSKALAKSAHSCNCHRKGVVVITPDQKAAILAKIADLNSTMSFLIGLTDDQRRKMLKMGDKTIGFEQKCASYMASRPDLIPGFVDTAKLGQDRAAWADVADIMHALLDLYQRVDDTDMVLAHQIYLPDLSFYQNVQLAVNRNVPGAQAIYDDLKPASPAIPTPRRSILPPLRQRHKTVECGDRSPLSRRDISRRGKARTCSRTAKAASGFLTAGLPQFFVQQRLATSASR